MTAFLDIPVAAFEIRPGDRLVPSVGTVRVVREVDRLGPKCLIVVNGFDSPELWNVEAVDTVTLRCPTEPTAGWSYYAGPQPGDILGCSCVYRWDGGAWAKAITLPTCTWCNPDEED